MRIKNLVSNRDEVFEIYPGLKKVDIHFTDNDAENITIKIVNSLKDKNNIITKKREFTEFMKEQVNGLCHKDSCINNWVKCDNECYKRSLSEVTEEINSTLYMLNVLGNSMINGNCKLILSENYELLTNDWGNDYQYFQPREGNENSRLIMAFGPSASGKTFMVENAIKMLRHTFMIGEGFPEVFLSIDGGIQRESSYAYSVIRDAIKDKNSGFKNLVSTGIISKSIFSSDKVKQNMKTFLNNNNKGFNLYIPETLSSCIKKINCSDKYDFYQKYTSDDNFVALNIWQHKKDTECDFKNGYQCEGTNKSGKSREQTEGKKYSDGAYDLSKRNGVYEITKTKGISMDIHNSGGPDNKSIIQLFGVNDFNGFKADVLLRDTGINAEIIYEYHDNKINDYKLANKGN